MQASAAHTDMQHCIDECLACYRICLHTAMNECLEMGGEHVEPTHFRFMINCAQMCRTAAEFMLSGSPLHARTCLVCAEVCDACARSCEQIGQMDKCVRACRACEQSCRRMAQGGIGMDLPEGMPPMPTAMQDQLPM